MFLSVILKSKLYRISLLDHDICCVLESRNKINVLFFHMMWLQHWSSSIHNKYLLWSYVVISNTIWVVDTYKLSDAWWSTIYKHRTSWSRVCIVLVYKLLPILSINSQVRASRPIKLIARNSRGGRENETAVTSQRQSAFGWKEDDRRRKGLPAGSQGGGPLIKVY